MLITTQAIVLRSLKYSESSIIGDIYTKEKGLRSFIISGIQGKKSKSKIGLLQVASLVEVVLYDKDQGSLNRIKEIRPDHLYRNLPFEIQRSSLALFMIELCRKSIKESEANLDMFHFLKDWFVFIDQSEESLALAHILFLIELSHLLGFGPSDLWTESRTYFDLLEGTYVAIAPHHLHYTSAETGHYLHMLFHLDKHNIHTLHIPKKNRVILLQKLLEFYSLHVDKFGELKSLHILQEIFQ